MTMKTSLMLSIMLGASSLFSLHVSANTESATTGIETALVSVCKHAELVDSSRNTHERNTEMKPRAQMGKINYQQKIASHYKTMSCEGLSLVSVMTSNNQKTNQEQMELSRTAK